MSESISVEVTNQRGLHARASAKIVKCMEEFDAQVTVKCNHRMADASSIMDLMMLGAYKGSVLSLKGSGSQGQKAVAAIRHLIEDKFGENK